MEQKMKEDKSNYVREEINSKEEAIKSLEGLHVKVYSRIKGKGLGLIEKMTKDPEELATNKELFISYITSISGDISNTVKRCLPFLEK